MSTPNSLSKDGFECFPKNVRKIIYKHLLRRQTTLKPLENAPIRNYFKPLGQETLLFSAGLNLLRTCKSVHREASNVLYGENVFLLNPPEIQSITQFFKAIGPINCSYLRNLKIDFDTSRLNAPVPWELTWIEEECAYIRSTLETLPDADLDWELAPPHNSQCFCSNVDHRVWMNRFLNDKIEPIDLFGRDERNRLENCYDGYPSNSTWLEVDSKIEDNAEWKSVISHCRICDSLQSLKNCTRLQTLELWFPDQQRSLVGFKLFRSSKDFLDIVQSYDNLSRLHVHGVDELALIENAVQGTQIREVIAELNSSQKRPFLGIEAGRPNLRAYANWKLLKSNRHHMVFRLVGSGPRVNRFSLLPAEIRFRIYDFVFNPWSCSCSFIGDANFTSSSPVGRWMIGMEHTPWGIHSVPNLSFRKQLIHVGGLMRTSKLIHSEFACQLYNRTQFIFPGFDPFHLSRQWNTGIADFMRVIGSANRRQIRNIAIWLNFDEYEYDNWGGQRRKFRPFVPCCGEGMHNFGKDKRFGELANLLYDVPKLGWLNLNLDESTELYRNPRANDTRIMHHQFQIVRSVALLFAPNIPIRVLELSGYISLACAEILGRYLGVEEVLLDCFFESEVKDVPGWNPLLRQKIVRLKFNRCSVQASKPNKRELEESDVSQWPSANPAKWTAVPPEQISWEP
ncbi:MAG: hypothetical protein Q9167_007993 [Letrouitia subvulpina]